MERSPLTTLVALSIVAVLAMAGMWLFTLNQVTDTSAARCAAAVESGLGLCFEPGGAARVTMVRDGTGLDAPRRYVVRYRPSQAVAADAAAMTRLAERAARIVVGHIDAPKGEVTIQCVAELPGGRDAQVSFLRSGSSDAWDVTPVTPAPPLPATRPPGGQDGVQGAPRDTEER